MGATSNESKQRWNSKHYTQVKVSVPQELAAAFKSKCEADGVSMARKLSDYMRTETTGKRPSHRASNPYETRPKRRKALAALIEQVEAIMAAEEDYKERIPENFQNSHHYSAAEESVEALGEALSFLTEAY